MPISMGADSRENVNHLVKDLLSHIFAKHNITVEGFVSNPRPSTLEVHVRHTVDALVDDSPELFTNLGEQLHLSAENIEVIFLGISDEIFVTGINWGRIVAFLAFGGAVATHCATKQSLKSQVSQIAVWMTDYVDTNLKGWIGRHGGWGGFISFFKLPGEKEDLKCQLGLRNWSLYALAGFGVGALLILVASHPNH